MISIILSIHNEEKTIQELIDRIDKTMRGYPALPDTPVPTICGYPALPDTPVPTICGYPNIPWEILAIDDASSDKSWDEISKARGKYKNVLPLRHSEKLGQKGCFMTGFKHANGDTLVLMDADLQVLPEELPAVLDKITVGKYEWVCTYNTTLKGGKPRNIISGIGNIFMRILFNTRVKDAGNNFVAFHKKHVRGLKLVANDQRYLLPIAASRTLHIDKITEVAVKFEKRKFGRSNYSMLKKAILGIPEMLALKKRIKQGFYAS